MINATWMMNNIGPIGQKPKNPTLAMRRVCNVCEVQELALRKNLVGQAARRRPTATHQ